VDLGVGDGSGCGRGGHHYIPSWVWGRHVGGERSDEGRSDQKDIGNKKKLTCKKNRGTPATRRSGYDSSRYS
jgi:hypothetical protein